MKHSIKKQVALSALAGGLMLAVSGAAVAGIANTKHNLGTTGTGTNHQTTGTGEICVFCHTPHGGNAVDGSGNAVAPLWNKGLPDASGFTTYDQLGTSSLDGSVVSIGSVSIACLSCHDGSQAMDNMINAPGSGGYNSSGAALAGSVWTGVNQLATEPFPDLGKDLRNDHPIGIEYAGGKTGGGAFAAADFVPSTSARDKDFNTAQYQSINSNDIWWVDVDNTNWTGAANTVSGSAISATANQRDKTDMQLYTRSSIPYVECASCHDPHVENVTFLRVDNTGSAVCLACHAK